MRTEVYLPFGHGVPLGGDYYPQRGCYPLQRRNLAYKPHRSMGCLKSRYRRALTVLKVDDIDSKQWTLVGLCKIGCLGECEA